mmetsp:Transcript_27198/g.75024  ORF Transcript_27198/g.75024 Transcript_27198/m.75024 type:complete len:609 (-) Transcript_27198:81-1907(-)
MIQYTKSAFGLGLLFRIQGSAVYRGCISGLFAMFVFYLVREFWDSQHNSNNDELQHPYAVGILVAALTFLLVFRAQAAYSRYWEACSAVHHMMSKWMDATTHTAIYHLQCDHYLHIKPPSFFEYPELNAHFLTRDREDQFGDQHSARSSELEPARISDRATVKSIESVVSERAQQSTKQRRMSKKQRNGLSSQNHSMSDSDRVPIPLQGPAQMDGGWGGLFEDGRATYFDKKNPDGPIEGGFASLQGGRTPPLFLQELAHQCSLLCAVALSTLRNDIEGAESPLDIYKPGHKWPEVDPTKDHAFELSFTEKAMIFLGYGRSPEARTHYNASRPLPVIGGVSEGEIKFLQMARGPSAKTQLCWQWLSEFIIREHLAGSTGHVGPPIISRIIQFLGDGMIYYNHARKIMFIPFPFPHAQLSSCYILVAIPAVAFLMDQYTVDNWVGAVLTFFTITALSGIHEVARELENPFRNVPNEIPLVTLQAQFNEALLTMYAGYHPDHFWRDSAEHYKTAPVPSTPGKKAREFNLVKPEFHGAPCTPTRGNVVSTEVPLEAPAQPSPSLEAQIQELVKKIEDQGRELESLRQKANDGDKRPQEEEVVFEKEQKNDV